MKVLFLDIDGVVNCKTTSQRHRGFIGIDPYMALQVAKMIEETGVSVVLSSSWRISPDAREEVRKQVYDFIDVTPNLPRALMPMTQRGTEIKAWLDAHPEVERYAILDDENDMLDEQQKNFFQSSWQTGITEDVIKKIIEHFK